MSQIESYRKESSLVLINLLCSKLNKDFDFDTLEQRSNEYLDGYKESLIEQWNKNQKWDK